MQIRKTNEEKKKEKLPESPLFQDSNSAIIIFVLWCVEFRGWTEMKQMEKEIRATTCMKKRRVEDVGNDVVTVYAYVCWAIGLEIIELMKSYMEDNLRKDTWSFKLLQMSHFRFVKLRTPFPPLSQQTEVVS